MASERTEKLVKYDSEHILHAQIPLGETLGVVYDTAQGISLWDTEGNEYLDASSQMVSCNLGHGRREIIDAAKAQLDKLQHVGQYYGHSSTPMVECAMKLAEITPGDLDHFWFTSGGGESTDAAIRLVRRYWTAVGQPHQAQGRQPLHELPRHRQRAHEPDRHPGHAGRLRPRRAGLSARSPPTTATAVRSAWTTRRATCAAPASSRR